MAKNQITAVDIGTNSVKVLQLEVTQAGVAILNSGVRSYPRQTATERISDEVVVDTLSQLVRDKVFRTKPVVMAIPRISVTVKELTDLPTSATDEDIDKMVPIQVAAELPFVITDAVYSAYNLQRSPESVSLEVVAAKRTAIKRYVDIAEEIGLKLQAIIPSSFATYGVVFDRFKEKLARKTLAVADIGAGMTDICIIQHGRLVFSRSFTFGGNLLTQQFEREYGLSFPAAEERKISDATLPVSPTQAGGMEGGAAEDSPARRWAEDLAKQIARSFIAFTGDETANGIDSLWLCGGSSLVSGLDTYLASRLNIDVSLWNPLQGIEGEIEDTRQKEDARHETQDTRQGEEASGLESRVLGLASSLSSESISRGLSVALGLGIIGMAGEKRTPTVNANLLPKEIREREERARRKITVSVVTVLAVLVLAAAALGFGTWRRSRAALYEDLADRLSKVEQKEETRNAIAALENSILMQQMMTSYVTPLEVLREMSNKLPDRRKVALTSLSMDKKGKVTMGVEAASYGDVSEMIQILSETKLLDKVKLFDEVKHGAISKVTKDKRPVFQVQIACSLNQDAMQEIDR